MADGSAQTDKGNRVDQWPIPKFHFKVTFSDGAGGELAEVPFQEVSGMDTEAQIIEYRAGNDKRFTMAKMPGLIKTSNVTLKKGMFKDDNDFWDWYSKIKMNTVARTTVTIELLDEAASPLHTWVLSNAFPTKITVTDLKADGNEVAVETLELAHEGIKQNGKSSPGE